MAATRFLSPAGCLPSSSRLAAGPISALNPPRAAVKMPTRSRYLSSSAGRRYHNGTLASSPPPLPPSIRERMLEFLEVSQAKLRRNEQLAPSRQQTITARVVVMRKHSRVTFINLVDGSGPAQVFLQVVLSKALHEEMNRLARAEGKGQLALGSVVEVTGTLLARSRHSERMTSAMDIELNAQHGRILTSYDDEASPLVPPPQVPKDVSGIDSQHRLRPHLRTLLAAPAATMRLRSRLETAMAAWLTQMDFVRTTPPIITASDCEGAGEVFHVIDDSLREGGSGLASEGKGTVTPPAYLTVSTQLHLEALMLGLSRVFTFTPAFRAEGSDTNRHLREFWMCEAEMVTSGKTASEELEMLMGVVEDLIKTAAQTAMGRALSVSVSTSTPTAVDRKVEKPTSGGDPASSKVTYEIPLVDSDVSRDAAATLDALYLWDLHTKDPGSGRYSSGGTGQARAAAGQRSYAFEQLADNLATTKTWPRITYTAAIRILHRQHETGSASKEGAGESRGGNVSSSSSFFHRRPPTWGGGLGSEHEKWLAEEYFGSPVFITDYPASSKPFYMRLGTESSEEINEGGEADEGGGGSVQGSGGARGREIVKNFDLLVPSMGELVGGSLREDDPKILLRRMRDLGLLPPTGATAAAAPTSSSSIAHHSIISTRAQTDEQADAHLDQDQEHTTTSALLSSLPSSHPLKWYIDDLRRHALPPHGGFGLGVERLVAWLARRGSVRECIPFPRVGKNVRF